MKSFFLACLLFLFSTSYANANAAIKNDLAMELTPTDLARLLAHEFIVKTRDVQNSPWPEITYYALIEASPLEAAGLFAAYDIQKDYVPNIIKSNPIKHISSTEVHTEYELYIPFPLSNAHYTHGAKIFKHGEDYETTWYMVTSTSAEEVRGSAYFQNMNGKTLFRYRSYVLPKSIFGALVKKTMLKDVEKSIIAIRNFIEKSKRDNPELLIKYSEFITRALRGEFVYQTIILKK